VAPNSDLPLAAVLAARFFGQGQGRLVALGTLAQNVTSRDHAPKTFLCLPRAQPLFNRFGLASWLHFSLIQFEFTSAKFF
jgi:hypothetical protein